MQARIRPDFRREAFGAHGGTVDFHERPQHRPSLAVLAAALVVEQGVGDDGLTGPEGVVDLGNPVQGVAGVTQAACVLQEGKPDLGDGQRVSRP